MKTTAHMTDRQLGYHFVWLYRCRKWKW